MCTFMMNGCFHSVGSYPSAISDEKKKILEIMDCETWPGYCNNNNAAAVNSYLPLTSLHSFLQQTAQRFDPETQF